MAGEPTRLIGIRPGDWLLLAVAVLATIAALLEDIPWTMAAPAVLAFAALVHGSDDPRPQVAIAVALVGAGMFLRWLRGQWWSVAWHMAGFSGALLAVRAFGEQPFADPRAQIAVLLAFAALAYLVALQERSVWVTGLSAAFAALAAQLVPLGQGNLVPTLALTFGYALAGSVLSRWRGGAWALGTFAAAVFASLLAVNRLSPFDPGGAEALLLVFAGASYLVAVLERRAWASVVPALYAMLAVVVQPDSHALLPLRWRCWRWHWPRMPSRRSSHASRSFPSPCSSASWRSPRAVVRGSCQSWPPHWPMSRSAGSMSRWRRCGGACPACARAARGGRIVWPTAYRRCGATTHAWLAPRSTNGAGWRSAPHW